MSKARPESVTPGDPSAESDPCGKILIRIQRGDDGAFEELYRGQGTILLAAVLRIVRNRSLAEEVLQDVFTDVWRSSSSFDPQRGTGRAWLMTMCRRRAIDRVRSVQAQQNRDFAEGVKEAHQQSPDLGEDVVEHVEAARAATALKNLPAHQAEAIALAYYHDLSHAEIARRLGVPLGTIKSRIRDGMRQLRVHMEVAP